MDDGKGPLFDKSGPFAYPPGSLMALICTDDTDSFRDVFILGGRRTVDLCHQ